jgi:hypothetical protein
MIGGFMSLKVGVAVRGEGAVFVDDFRYEPLD